MTAWKGLSIIDSTMQRVLPAMFDSPEARVMLIAIGLQESRFIHTEQIGGPARGYWQFELGGVNGVMLHMTTKHYARAVCEIRRIQPAAMDVYRAISKDDDLACAFARLLLYAHPKQLPAITDPSGAWEYYLQQWRPGKPHPKTWAGFHAQAVEAVKAAP